MEYQRREGCSNLGGDYEYLMTALFSLRCALSENVEAFWIASNASFVGDCDDIVLSIKSTKGVKSAYLIQLKHMETKKKLMPKHFTYSRESKKEKTDKNQKEKKDDNQKENTDENQKENIDEKKEPKSNKKKDSFAIEKYWKGFEKLQENLANPEHKSDIIKELGEVHDTTLILYTNREVEDCNFFKQVDSSDNFFDLLGTNGIKHCHGFDHSKLPNCMFGWEKFLQKFYLFANQIHAEGVINVMETEIQNYFKLTVPLMVNFEDVVKEYLEYVRTWIKGYKIGKDRKYCAITKPDVLKTLTGILLNQYNSRKYDFSTKEFTSYTDTIKMIWNKIISDKDITLLNNSDESVVTFIQSYYGSESLKYLIKLPKVWNQVLSKNAQKSFYKIFGHAKVAQVCHNFKLSIMQIYKTLWMHGCVPMLLHLDDTKYFKDVLKMLQVCKHSIKVIALVADSSKVQFIGNNLKSFVTLQDLDPDQQNKLLGVNVSLQGRIYVPLNSLVVDPKMYENIKCHDVIRIVSQNFIIGNEFEKVPEYFIPQSVSRTLLRQQVLELSEETFLIETKNAEVARNRRKVFIAKQSKVHFMNSDELMSKKQKFLGKTVHRLVDNEVNFVWKESSGNIANLQKYIIPVEEHETYNLVNVENLKNNCRNTASIFSAGPGMGKSTMMDYVAQNASKDVWITQIKLSHRVLPEETSSNKKSLRRSTPTYYNSDISDVSSDDEDIPENAFNAVKYFEKLLTEDEQITAPEISLAVFRNYYKTNKILILLDGFDDISINHKVKMTNFIQLLQRKQHAVWVTTRDHMKAHLEESLSALASTLKPFTLAEQQFFLINYFNSNVGVKNEPVVSEFADRLLKAAAENFSARDNEFTGIPLQLKLLADVFLKKCEESCKNNVVKFNKQFDLLTIYKKFIEKKNYILSLKFGSNEEDWSKSEHLIKAQTYFALRTVFDLYSSKRLDIDVTLAHHYETVGKQLLQRGGIVVIRDSKNGIVIDFIHRTFAEYFTAKYLAENLLSSDDRIRTNVLSLIKVRLVSPGYFQFLFTVFDRIVAKKNPLHLSIINIKHDYLSLKIDKDPNLLLQCDNLKRSGFHMLALYEKDFLGENLSKIFKKMFEMEQVFKKCDLTTNKDLLGYTALDYCFYFRSELVANFLCKLKPYFPLNWEYRFSINLNDELVLQTVFHNLCISALLDGIIFENNWIAQSWNRLTLRTKLTVDQFKFLEKLSVVRVRDYLELVRIKEINATKYYDVRFAVVLGTVDNVKDLLDSTNADINEKDFHNNATLVQYALYHSRYDMFDELLKRGADLNILDKDGNTAFHLLACKGKLEILKKYRSNIVIYNARNNNRETPLDVALKVDECRAKDDFLNIDSESKLPKVYYAAGIGDNELLRTLLANGCNINHQLHNETALHASLKHKHVDTANILIERNIDLSTTERSHDILHLAAKIGNRQLFEKLLSKGLNINEQNEFGETPLFVSINYAHVELAKVIISKGADVSITTGETLSVLSQALIMLNNEEELISSILDKGGNIDEIILGKNILHLALQNRKPSIARLLLNRTAGPNITIEDISGNLPLHSAAEHGYADLVVYFLEKGVNVDAQNIYKQTPLLLALEGRGRNTTVAEILLDYNANVLLEDYDGNTPLHYAAGLGNSTIIEKIIKNGGEVNKVNNKNATPLLWALNNGHCEAINLLLQRGGDLTKGYYDGSSSLHLAAEHGNNEVVRECLKLNMDVNMPDKSQDTPLLLAVAKDKVETARLLIDNGANVFQSGFNKNTILHKIYNISQEEFKLEILKKNVDVNAVNDSGHTPLFIAIEKKDLNTAKLLLSHGANLDTICNNGQSILHIAAFSNFHDLVLKWLNKDIFDFNLEDCKERSHWNALCKEYQRREGCSNLGGDYEYLMTALFSLRCSLSENVEEFWIASNANFVGDCDDIVLSIKSTKGVKSAYLIQLKHMETKKKLKPKDFFYSIESKKEKTDDNQKENTDEQKEPKSNKKKDSFAIEKYWKGFEKLQENLANPEHKSDIIKKLEEVHDTTLILYTNRQVENCNFLKEVDLSDNFFDLLRTNDIEHSHGFDHSKLPERMSGWEKFLQKFYLFANQIHAEGVINVMETEIQNYFKLTVPLMVNFEDVVKEYLEYVKTWIKGYTIGIDRKYCAITKPDVLKTLVGILLNQYNSRKYDFSTKEFTSYTDTIKMIWNKIISDKDITLLNNSDESVVTFIQSYYGSESLKYLIKLPRVWNQVLSKNAQKIFYKTFGHAKVAQVCHNFQLSIMQIYKTLWMHGSVPMLLHLDDTKYFKDVLKMLQVCKHSIKVIALVADSSKVEFIGNNLKSFVTLQDLNSDEQKQLLGLDVSFQGRIYVPLNSLVVDPKMYDNIKCHDVIRIVSQKFIIGNEFEKVPEYFIPQSVSRTLLRQQVLELSEETFLIETKNAEVARNRRKVFIAKQSKVHFMNSDELMPKKQKFLGETVHRLVDNEVNFVWKESSENIANLRKYIIPLDKHESYNMVNVGNLKNNYRNTASIFSAGPGMGKSTMMDYVAQNASKDVWVIQIKLGNIVLPEETSLNKKSLRRTDSTPTYYNSDISDVSSDDENIPDNAFNAADEEDIPKNAFNAVKYFEKLLKEDKQINAPEISLPVFRKFHRANKILILLDGFDEISINHKVKMTKFIQLLQSQRYAVWVTTRDHMKAHLEESLSTLASTLKPFTLAEQQSFLINYFNDKVEVKNELIVKEFAERLLNAAARNLRARDSEFTGVPLQTKLLADVFLKKCKESCINNAVKFNEQFDLLKLYNKFIQQKNKILTRKLGSSVKEYSKSEHLVEAETNFALRTVFDSPFNRTINKIIKHLKIDKKLDDFHRTVDSQLIQKSGILVVRDSKNGTVIDFIHRTFAEYFAAKYLAKHFLSSNDCIRTNVLSLIKERFEDHYDYQFLFMVFDRIVAKKNPLHLSIVNIKHVYLSHKIDKKPNLLLQCDKLKRSGLHMLAVYERDFSFENFRKVLEKMFDKKQVFIECDGDLSTKDLLGYTALDYCFYFRSKLVANFLCQLKPYFPLNWKYRFSRYPYYDDFVLRTVFHNLCISALLRGHIFVNDLIAESWNKFFKRTELTVDQFKYLKKLCEVRVRDFKDYLECVEIKEINAHRYSDIRLAVVLGTVDNVKDLLDSTKADINEQDFHNNATLIHYALYHSRYDMFYELLERGADLNILDKDGNTAFHLLARDKKFKILKENLSNIAIYNARNNDQKTPLDVALRVDESQAKLDFLNIDSESKLPKVYYAAGIGDNELLDTLLTNGCNINHQLHNETALHAALKHKHVNTANFLIERNIDLSTTERSHDILHLAAKIGNRQLFEKLLSKGLNIDEQDEFGETPLCVSIFYQHAELAKFIISQDADVSIRSTKHRVSVFSLALMMLKNEEELISSIVNKSSNIDEIDHGKTFLHKALDDKKPSIARLLLNKTPGPNITIEDNSGNLPLHYAAENGYAYFVLDFLKKGVNVDAQNIYERTPLLLALEREHTEVAEILLDYNANGLLETCLGITALHYAAKLGKSTIIDKIIKNGGDVNKVNSRNATPLLWALKHGYSEAINLLLQRGGDLTIGYYDGSSSLHLAAEHGYKEVVRECLKLNMDVNAVDDYGHTPLFMAIKRSDLITAKLLVRHGANLDKICKDRLSGVKRIADSSNLHDLVLEQLNNGNFDINLEDCEERSPLECVLQDRSLESFMLLLHSHVKSNDVYIWFSKYLTQVQNKKQVTRLINIAEKLVKLCDDLNELDVNGNTLLINIFTTGFSSCSNRFQHEFFCQISNVLLDSGADENIKGNTYRSVKEIYDDAFEDKSGKSDELLQACLWFKLDKRLNRST